MAGPNLAQRRIVDPVLTTIAQGYASPTLIGTELLPVVPVNKEGGKVPQFGKEAFMAYHTQRAPRGAFQRVDFGVGSISFVLDDHGIEVPLDQREIDESTDILDLEAAATETAQGIIMRTHERNVAALVSNPASYPAGNTSALGANDRWDAYTQSTSDPLQDVEAAKEAIRGKVGVRPNVMCVGAKVRAALVNHPLIVDRIKYSQRGVVTDELLAQVFGVERFVVGDDVTAAADGTFSDVWGKVAILAVVPAQRRASMGTPAFGYTLRKRSYPVVRKYWDDPTTSQVVQAQDILKPAILGPGAGYLYTTVVS